MHPNSSILTFNIAQGEENIKIRITGIKHMILTFFCKRGRHGDCPGQWPIDDRGRCDHDCSFDIKMIKCICDCHRTVS